MVLVGQIIQLVIDDFVGCFSVGDVIIDGGNFNFYDIQCWGEVLVVKGLYFVDVGIFGGVWGIIEGYGMMVGGFDEGVECICLVLEVLVFVFDWGWGYMGLIGSGYYVKMVYNGIEYGMMQVYVEGFELMKVYQIFNFDMVQIVEVWCYGMVICLWLFDLIVEVLKNSVDFDQFFDYVVDLGEGCWMIIDFIEFGVLILVIMFVIQMCFCSQQDVSYQGQMFLVMCCVFGGYVVKMLEVIKQESVVLVVKFGESFKVVVFENIFIVVVQFSISGCSEVQEFGEIGQQCIIGDQKVGE